MRRITWPSLLAVLFLAAWGGSAPVEGRKQEGEVEPLAQLSFLERFEGHKRASVIIIGDGQTYLGVYVFDSWGNCVARDDSSLSKDVRDDLAVAWFPEQAGAYTMDVCNFGTASNEFVMVIR